MEDNKIRDVIVDHFLMKKEKSAISQRRYLGHWSYETFHTVSMVYCIYNRKIFMVAMVTKLEQNKFNWK